MVSFLFNLTIQLIQNLHERTTGAEILAAFGKDGLDAFVAGVGTGGTISGVSHALKSVNSNIQVFAVEADESAILSGENLDHTKFKVSQLDLFLIHLIQKPMMVLFV